MPYARKSFSRKSYYSKRRGTRGTKPPGSVPVPRKKRASTARRNALAINTLARHTRQIKAMTYGSVQTGLHKLNLSTIQVTKDHPYLWDMTDMSRYMTSLRADGTTMTRFGAHVYTLGQDPITAAVATVQNSYWVRSHDTSPYFKDCNDVPDTGKYLPIYAEYNIRVSAFNVTRPITVTFHMFVAKPQTMTSVGTELNDKMLPKSLVNMTNMADPVDSIFPAQYFKLYSKRTIKIFPMHNAQNHDFIRNIKLVVKPKGERNQDSTQNATPLDANGELPGGNWAHLNCPITEPYWCLCSTDIPYVLISDSQTNPYVTLAMTRKVVFRDHIGASGGKIMFAGGVPAKAKRTRFG